MSYSDEDDFESLRQKRKLMLQKQMRQAQDWKQLGHGKYSEVNDTKEFFNIAKKSARVVAHFYRSVTPRCTIVDAHFEKLANTHIETRFIKVDVEKCPYLVEKLGIIFIPTIILIKDGKTDHSIRGFDEFGGVDDFSTADVAHVLAGHQIIKPDIVSDRSEEIAKSQAISGLNHVKIKGGLHNNAVETLSDDEDNYDV